ALQLPEREARRALGLRGLHAPASLVGNAARARAQRAGDRRLACEHQAGAPGDHGPGRPRADHSHRGPALSPRRSRGSLPRPERRPVSRPQRPRDLATLPLLPAAWRIRNARGEPEMKRSTERILTTHVGSLARPEALVPLLKAKDRAQPYDRDGYTRLVREAVADVVRRQTEAGVDVITDGEQSKASF